MITISFSAWEEIYIRHSVTDNCTNLSGSPALLNIPAPAGLVVGGRDWEGVEVGDALGCSVTILNSGLLFRPSWVACW